MTRDEQLLELIKLAMEVTSRTEYTVDYEFSSNVNRIDFHIFDKNNSDSKYLLWITTYISGELSKHFEAFYKDMSYLLKNILTHEKLNLSLLKESFNDSSIDCLYSYA